MKCASCGQREATHKSKKVNFDIKVICEKCHNEEVGDHDILDFFHNTIFK